MSNRGYVGLVGPRNFDGCIVTRHIRFLAEVLMMYSTWTPVAQQLGGLCKDGLFETSADGLRYAVTAIATKAGARSLLPSAKDGKTD